MTKDTKTFTLTEFLLARIAEDEDLARRAAFGWGATWSVEIDSAEDWATVHADGKRDMVGCEDGDVSAHIARHDPARVLAECEAKRLTVAARDEAARAAADPAAGAEMLTVTRVVAFNDTLRTLAAVYSDHPDYDEAWRP